MDLAFKVEDKKFNYRVCSIFINEEKILAMRDDRSPYYYLPGGRVQLGERAEDAIIREAQEELHITPEIIRPLWLAQSFFNEDVDGIDYHELCIYFLMDFSKTDLLLRGQKFCSTEDNRTHVFEWLELNSLKEKYFYPIFLKEKILSIPNQFTLITSIE